MCRAPPSLRAVPSGFPGNRLQVSDFVVLGSPASHPQVRSPGHPSTAGCSVRRCGKRLQKSHVQAPLNVLATCGALDRLEPVQRDLAALADALGNRYLRSGHARALAPIIHVIDPDHAGEILLRTYELDEALGFHVHLVTEAMVPRPPRTALRQACDSGALGQQLAPAGNRLQPQLRGTDDRRDRPNGQASLYYPIRDRRDGRW
jgi:hypothetical protein